MIKGMSEAAWDRALRHAKRAGEPMAAWIARAIGELADREDRNEVIPPGNPGPTKANGHVEPQPAGYPDTVPTGELASLLQSLVALATVPVRSAKDKDKPGLPVGVRDAALAAAGLRLREAKGLPAPVARKAARLSGPAAEG
jgi:hypothetical protein